MIDGELDIVRAAIRGESSAFGRLYDAYQPAIYRFVFFKVGGREDAEDITHHVFLRAWESIRGYKPRGYPFSSFLYRIARNQVIDYYRAKREVTAIHDAAETEPTLMVMPAVAANIDTRIELDRVREVLHTLKPEYQDVIILRLVEELSIEETAATLKKTPGAVKVLQHRALKQLRERLGDAAADNEASDATHYQSA